MSVESGGMLGLIPAAGAICFEQNKGRFSPEIRGQISNSLTQNGNASIC